MPGKDLNWIEARILTRLNDRGHAVVLSDLADNLIKDKGGVVLCAVTDLAMEGYVVLREPPNFGDQLVEITAEGKRAILQLLSGRSDCD